MLILIINAANQSFAKKEQINFKQSKVAVEVNIKDISQQIRMGVTAFGDYKGEGKEANYKMPQYVTEHIDQTFNELGINFEFVTRDTPSESELKDLKRKAQRKIREQHYDDFLVKLKKEGFTELLTFNFFPQKVRDHRVGIPVLNGYGTYKIAGANCIYQTLGYFHVDLKGKQKNRRFDVVQEIPEKNKPDHVCKFGENIKKLGIDWQKDASDYSLNDRAIIEKTLKNSVLDALLDTFNRHGIIENQLTANRLYINFTQDDYTVIEKIDSSQYSLNDQMFNQSELIEYFQTLVKSGKELKILAGLESKSKYTFGDIKELFLPVFKNTNVAVYRLGPNFEVIKI